MSESSLLSTPNRLAAEGEQLIVHRFPGGWLGLAPLADVRVHEKENHRGSLWERITRCFQVAPPPSSAVVSVSVPSGAHLILKGIPGSIQQKYGLEWEEGAVFLQSSGPENGHRHELRFNNGVRIRLQELRAGQLVELLSLAGLNPAFYEQEFQLQ